MIFLLLVFSFVRAQQEPLGRNYWEQSGRADLEEALKTTWNTGLARNVIIFVGDGMGPNTVTAGRIYNGGETSYLSWEKLPHVGALKTYAEDKTVPDSAATATSMFTGVKANYNVLGLPGSVKKNDCSAALRSEAQLTHLTTLAQEAGKSTGIVTTARVTHATPGAMYARSAHRDWECYVPENATGCKDIGRQMVEDLPARNLNVILGGGRYMLQSNLTQELDPTDGYCVRTDGRDLIDEWAKEKASRNLSYAVVNNTKSLRNVNVDKTDYLLGIFSKNHMPFEHDRDTSDDGTPSLLEMTIKALNILKKNSNGFLLMVEAEHVDLAHHLGKARRSVREVVLLSDTINATLHFLEQAGIKDETLLIVTSDHSHTLTISGYPERGTSILGVAQKSKADGIPYTTLSYANGHSRSFHYTIVNGVMTRDDPTKVDTTDWEYGHQVGVITDKNSHGGHDVFVYASGPYAHLFHHMHEQNYVYYVVTYAAKLGEFSQQQYLPSTTSSSSSNYITSYLFVLVSMLFYRC